ncbi:hypothetical protein FPHYL_12893 [Fusarium phyllophilum]|uniref:Uncharacterized protein n=1 Tax=Fusarium phyllophilum TaxID=47803 RepID=A0A8H5MQW2_9HYPO|nr:hypothetical protein FPHYL_12893 [Fusarium phyllophilum]
MGSQKSSCWTWTKTECKDFRWLDASLEDPEQQEWECSIDHAQLDQLGYHLKDPIYSFKRMKVDSIVQLMITKLGTNFDKELRDWQKAFGEVESKLSGLRGDYLKGLLGAVGAEKYKELALLEKPGQEDLQKTLASKRPIVEDGDAPLCVYTKRPRAEE